MSPALPGVTQLSWWAHQEPNTDRGPGTCYTILPPACRSCPQIPWRPLWTRPQAPESTWACLQMAQSDTESHLWCQFSWVILGQTLGFLSFQVTSS